MQHQRVLYTNKFTAKLKSKLRIVSYDKQQTYKKNVYFVSFASDADMKIADRAVKRFPNATLKPVQFSSSKTQHKHRISTCSTQESLSLPSPPIPFLSPSTTLSFLPDCHSTFITSHPSPLRRADETLEERAIRVLGPLISARQSVAPTLTLQASNLNMEQLINNVQSCLSAMETSRRAANEICQLHERGVDCREALNHLFKVHSTAFYLKVATSAQIKAAFFAGLRLPWSAVANSINVLKTDVRHEQVFMTQVTSAKHISSKIDSATSIAMSSKLAYQLAKLSD